MLRVQSLMRGSVSLCNIDGYRKSNAAPPYYTKKGPCQSTALRDARGTSSSTLIDDGEDVVFGHDEQFVAIDVDFVAGVRGEQNAVAFLDLERGSLAIVQELAVADAQDFALPRLFLGGVGQHDAARGLFLG